MKQIYVYHTEWFPSGFVLYIMGMKLAGRPSGCWWMVPKAPGDWECD